MKLNEILQLDCRKEGAMKELHNALERLPFFKDGQEISVVSLEKAINYMSGKYPIQLSYLLKAQAPDTYYSCMIRCNSGNEWLKTIYGNSIFECFAKVTIFMYAYIKNTWKKGETE